MTPEQWDTYFDFAKIVTDAIGRNIDYEIREAVVGLWVNGFWTLSSCGGHADRQLVPSVELTRDAKTLTAITPLLFGFELEIWQGQNFRYIRPKRAPNWIDTEYWKKHKCGWTEKEWEENIPKYQQEFKRFGRYLQDLAA